VESEGRADIAACNELKAAQEPGAPTTRAADGTLDGRVQVEDVVVGAVDTTELEEVGVVLDMVSVELKFDTILLDEDDVIDVAELVVSKILLEVATPLVVALLSVVTTLLVIKELLVEASLLIANELVVTMALLVVAEVVPGEVELLPAEDTIEADGEIVAW